MSNSFSFNSVDMSSYGLRVRSHEEPFVRQSESLQLLHRAYGLGNVRPARNIVLDVAVKAADLATLLSYLDSIKAALNEPDDCALTIDSITDRYWLARFVSMQGSISVATVWEGTLTFIAFDPDAYDNDETSSGPTTVDEDPEEVTETLSSATARTFPVYTLTCDDTLDDTTVGIENEATGEMLEWTGDLVSTDVLEIDTANFTVKLNGSDDMDTVDGEFPSLLPGANVLNITGFSGTITITYRERYV